MTWQLYLREQWNNPSRSDYYTMQLSAVVGSLFSKNPAKLEDQKIKFQFEGEDKPTKTIAQIASEAKARWMGWLGTKRGK